jgi:hypothetical protein
VPDDETPVGIPRTAGAWSQVARAVHDAIRPNAAQDRKDHVTSILDQFEAELAPLIAPVVQQLAADPNTHESLRPLLEMLAGPQAFTGSLGIGIAVGAIISPVLGAAIAPVVQDLANNAWPKLQVMPLSGDLLAAAVLKGVLPLNAATTEAATVGFDPAHFKTMVDTAGQAIGIEEALLLWRRNQISELELERIVHYSNVRSDFLKDIKLLRYQPPGAGEVIAGLTKGHLDTGQATTMLSDAGIDPVNLDWLHKTAGRPIGIEQMLHLWNRNAAIEQDVVDAVHQSDINDHYLKFVLELATYIPPPRSIVPMLRSGGIDEARARVLLAENGVRAVDADAFIAEAHTTRTTSLKQLSASQVIRAYEDRLIDQPTAMARLEGLKYPAADATLMLQIADEAVLDRYRTARVARVHNRYVAHKISANTATSELSKFGIPGPAISQYMTLWTDERDANTAVLSLAQNQGAYHRGILTLAQFVGRAQALGYSGLDVKIVAAEAWPPTRVPAEVVALNPANL